MKKLAFSFQCLTFVLSLATVAPLKETAEAQGSDTRWGPVLKKDGNEEELPSDPKKKLGDKEWMNVTYREYNGAKPSIAVIMAGNQAPNQTYWEWSDGVNSYKIPIEAYQVPNGAPVAAIEDLLTAVLMNTNRFTVADRQQLADVRAEQQLGTDGSSTAQTAPPPGRIIGARYLIKAVVNEWKDGASRSGGGGGVLGGGLPGIIGS